MKTFVNEFDALRNEAIHEVIVEARKIMTKHSHLVEFLMAMGTYYFIDKNNEIVSTLEEKYNPNWTYCQVDSKSYFKTLNNFMLVWDDTFKLTGEGIRFKLTGKIITDW